MKKKYTNVRLYSNRSNEKKYILELITNQGYANEMYEFNTREEAKEALNTASWIKEHPYALQDYEEFESMTFTELLFMKTGLVTLKQMRNFYKWCMR